MARATASYGAPGAAAAHPRDTARGGGRARPRRGSVGRLGGLAAGIGALLIVAFLVPALGGSELPGAFDHRSGASHDLVCNGADWRTTHLAVFLSGCQAIFAVQYAENFSQPGNLTDQYNFSFAIPWIAEITPAGDLVRMASALEPVAATTNLTRLPEEVVLSSLETLNVTNASGSWNPNDTLWGSGTPWTVSNQTVGNATVGLSFYLLNTTVDSGANVTENTSLAVQFDFTVGEWPWASSADLLAFGLDSLGAGGSHFVFNRTSRALEEQWNSTNATFVSLVFGTSANVSYPDGELGRSTVTEQAGEYEAGTPGRESVVLATFGAVTGGYSFLVYDPWVVFSPGSTGTSPPPPVASAPSGWPGWVAVALALLAAAGGMGGIGTVVLRDARLRSEGRALVRDMRTEISPTSEPRPPPR